MIQDKQEYRALLKSENNMDCSLDKVVASGTIRNAIKLQVKFITYKHLASQQDILNKILESKLYKHKTMVCHGVAIEHGKQNSKESLLRAKAIGRGLQIDNRNSLNHWWSIHKLSIYAI